MRGKGNHKTSILVLESNDISLGNHIDIADAVTKELSQRGDDVPDEVYLVETDGEPWTVWILKEGEKSFLDVPNAGPHYIEPHTLDKH